MDLLKLLSDMRRQALDMQDQAEKAVGLAAAEAKGKWEGQVERLERELMVGHLALVQCQTCPHNSHELFRFKR
jgi:hypothetical protein